MKVKVFATIVAGLFALGANAGMTWVTGSYSPTDWNPAANNVLKGLSATKTGDWYTESGVSIGNNVSLLTDGAVSGATVDYTKIAALKTGVTLAWTFTSVASISKINIYSRWGSGGRDGICITKVEVKHSGSDSWVDLNAPEVAFQTKAVTGNNTSYNQDNALMAVLAQSDGGPLAENATALRLTFGTQDNNGTGYVEIEAVATGPVWTVGKWKTADWQPVEQNLLMLHSPCSSANPDGSATFMVDGKIDVNQGKPYFNGNCSKTWYLDGAYDLRELRLWTGWPDSGRDQINITSVSVKYAGDADFTPLTGAVAYDAKDNNYHNYAILKDAAGGYLAKNVVALRVSFGSHENSGVCYQEVELIGDERPCFIALGSYNEGKWDPDPKNRLPGATFTVETTGPRSETGSKSAYLHDGAVKGGSCIIGNNSVHSYAFAEPFDLGRLGFYAGAGDKGVDGICIAEIGYKTSHDAEDWTPLNGFDGFSWGLATTASSGYLSAIITPRAFDEPLAAGVTDLRIVYGKQDNDITHYTEIEAVEWTNPYTIPCQLGECWAAVDVLKVRWSAEVTLIGSGDEATLTLYTSTDGGATYAAEKAWTLTEPGSVNWEREYDKENLQVLWYFDCVNTCRGQSFHATTDPAETRTANLAAPVGEVTATEFVNTNLYTVALTLSTLGNGATKATVDARVYADAAQTQLVAEQRVATDATSAEEPFVARLNGIDPNKTYYVVFHIENDAGGEADYAQSVRYEVPRMTEKRLTWKGWGDGTNWRDPYNWGVTDAYPSDQSYTAVIPANSDVILTCTGSKVQIGFLIVEKGAKVLFKDCTNGIDARGGGNASLQVADDVSVTLDNSVLSASNDALFFTQRNPLLKGLSIDVLNGSTLSALMFFVDFASSTLRVQDSSFVCNTEFNLMSGVSSVFDNATVSFKNGGTTSHIYGPTWMTNTTVTVGDDNGSRTLELKAAPLALAGDTVWTVGARQNLKAISGAQFAMAGIGTDEPSIKVTSSASSLQLANASKLTLDLTGMGTERHTRTKDRDWTLFSSAGTLTFPAAWTNGANLAEIVKNSNGKVEAVNAEFPLKRYQLLYSEKDGGEKALVLRYNKPKNFAVIVVKNDERAEEYFATLKVLCELDPEEECSILDLKGLLDPSKEIVFPLENDAIVPVVQTSTEIMKDVAANGEALTATEPDKIKIPLATGIYDVKIVFTPAT